MKMQKCEAIWFPSGPNTRPLKVWVNASPPLEILGQEAGEVLDFEHERCSTFNGSQTSALPPHCRVALSELLYFSEPRHQFQLPSKDLSLPDFSQLFLSDWLSSSPSSHLSAACWRRIKICSFPKWQILPRIISYMRSQETEKGSESL